MRATLNRILWLAIILCAIAYGVFLVAGSRVYAEASGVYDPVLVHDLYDSHTHMLSGMLFVNRSCEQIEQHITQIGPSVYKIIFTTREDSSACKPHHTPRAFKGIITASEEISLIAVRDGIALPVRVLKETLPK